MMGMQETEKRRAGSAEATNRFRMAIGSVAGR